jgi:phage baseplate assembly protein W
MTTYSGFSTFNRTRNFKLTDFELVKQDLINHFYIRKGEKLMNPKFGSIIWDILFDPFTPSIKELILADIKTITSYDPRLSVDELIVTQFQFGIQIVLTLRYVTTNQLSAMTLKFNRDSKSLSIIN